MTATLFPYPTLSRALRPVDRSMTVSAPQRIDQTILSTSAATSLATALLPILALILTRKLRPIAIGSLSGWLMLLGMIARPVHDHDGGRERVRLPVFRSRIGHQRRSDVRQRRGLSDRSEEHTSELQSLMRISYAVFCLKQKKIQQLQHMKVK